MNVFNFERYEAHGWVVHRKMLAVDDSFETVVGPDYDIATASDVAVWTKGRVSVVDKFTGYALPDKVPGDSILRKGSYKEGHYLCVAKEPSEFWCVNRKLNRQRYANGEGLGLICLEPGQEQQYNEQVLICSGAFELTPGQTLTGPKALRAGWVVRALTPTYGFRFVQAGLFNV